MQPDAPGEEQHHPQPSEPGRTDRGSPQPRRQPAGHRRPARQPRGPMDTDEGPVAPPGPVDA